jgi:hypothetical protein
VCSIANVVAMSERTDFPIGKRDASARTAFDPSELGGGASMRGSQRAVLLGHSTVRASWIDGRCPADLVGVAGLEGAPPSVRLAVGSKRMACSRACVSSLSANERCAAALISCGRASVVNGGLPGVRGVGNRAGLTGSQLVHRFIGPMTIMAASTWCAQGLHDKRLCAARANALPSQGRAERARHARLMDRESPGGASARGFDDGTWLACERWSSESPSCTKERL